MYSIPGHTYLMVETTLYPKTTQILFKVSTYTACLGYEAQDTSYSYGSALTIKAVSHQNDILILMLEINQSKLDEGVRRTILRNTFPQLKAEQHMLDDTFLTDPTTSSSTFQHLFIIKICYFSKLLTAAGKVYMLSEKQPVTMQHGFKIYFYKFCLLMLETAA